MGAGGAIANRDIRNFKDGPKLRICVNFDHKTLNMVFFSSIEKIFLCLFVINCVVRAQQLSNGSFDRLDCPKQDLKQAEHAHSSEETEGTT